MYIIQSLIILVAFWVRLDILEDNINIMFDIHQTFIYVALQPSNFRASSFSVILKVCRRCSKEVATKDVFIGRMD